MTSRQDKFGFYQVGELKFYSKLEAIETSKQTGLPFRWIFNDEVFSSYDWTVEPTESLEELYRQRAQQIRDNYDYIVVWYSGGADSANILDSFVKNGIKLDEVLSYVNYNASGSKEDPTNGEIFHVAVPRVQEIRKTQPWIKHRVVDLSQSQVDYFSQPDAKFDWIYGINGYVSPHNISKQAIKTNVSAWQEMYASGKRVAHVFGLQKPIVTQIGDEYYTNFVDRIDNGVTAESQMLDRPWEFNELFYWSPDAVKIMIKQCHVIKRYLKTVTPEEMTLDITTQDNFQRKPEWGPTAAVKEWRAGAIWVTTTDKNLNKYFLTYDAIHRLIYPWWYPVPYQIKPHSMTFSHKDYWFFNLADDNAGKQAWKIGFDKLWSSVPDQFKNSPAEAKSGFKTTASRSYQIGK